MIVVDSTLNLKLFNTPTLTLPPAYRQAGIKGEGRWGSFLLFSLLFDRFF